MRHFPYIKQNSIAEIVSTMESFLVAGRGFFIALRRRIVVCRASIHSARHTPCFVRSRGAKRILNPFGLLAPDLLRRSVGLYTTQQPTKKGHRLVSFSLCCTALIDANIDPRLIQFFQTINNIRNVTYLLIG